MKIAILGTRGVPNHYGGFEQITESLSVGLADRGHDVTVYNSHNHPYKKNNWKNIQLVHCYDPEYILKTAGQFIYDLNCILDARKKKFDVIIFMGYTSSSIWRRFFPKESLIITNMDGMEWKRAKYSKPVRWFLRYAEKLAVKYSHFHIADSTAIRKYIHEKYGISCMYIPYGANMQRRENKTVLRYYNALPQQYYLLMARMEPENNIALVLEGFHLSKSKKKFIVIGSTENYYGKQIQKKYEKDKRICFIGPVFNQDAVHTLRKHAALYFHGHSVGGTNPSLLEAMASGCSIAAHDNEFNRAILNNDAYYFSKPGEITNLVERRSVTDSSHFIQNNLLKISENYRWDLIIDQYDDFICSCYQHEHEKIIDHRRYAFK